MSNEKQILNELGIRGVAQGWVVETYDDTDWWWRWCVRGIEGIEGKHAATRQGQNLDHDCKGSSLLFSGKTACENVSARARGGFALFPLSLCGAPAGF